MASPAMADQTAPLEGTWGGAEGDVSAQVIVTSGVVIGFFWRGDYLDTSNAKLSADGASLSFAFQGGTATLIRTAEGEASLTIVEAGKSVQMNLKRD